VGKVSFKNGKVSVPVTCSTQASGGCQVMLRLTVLESLSGSRIVAIAAGATHSTRVGAASLRHVTVTLASARAHLSRELMRPRRHTPRDRQTPARRQATLRRKRVRQRHRHRRDRSPAGPAASHTQCVRSQRIHPCRPSPLAAPPWPPGCWRSRWCSPCPSRHSSCAASQSDLRECAQRRTPTPSPRGVFWRRPRTWAGTRTSPSAGATARRPSLDRQAS